MSALNSLILYLLDWVAPPRPSELVVRQLSVDDLANCSMQDGALSYRDPRVRALVWELKYHHNPRAAALAGEYVAESLLAIASEEIDKPLLIPMPMHAARYRERGYNQTELLCESALKALGKSGSKNSLGAAEDFFDGAFSYMPNILVRIRNTAPQQGLARHKRLKNVKNSMEIINPASIKGRVCIVVDDVSTTGATFAEAKRALLKAGAKKVIGECLARS